MADGSSDLSSELKDEDLAGVSSGSDDDSDNGAADRGSIERPVVLGRVDYKAQSKDQLSFKKGERIQVLGPANGGWFKGRLESTHADGLVPVGYVHAEGEKPDEPEKDVIVLVVKCLRDHQAADAMHLSFKKHDRIEITDSSDAKLWKGRLKGKVGLVARSMVEEDKGYTIRRATEKKEQTRGQFRAAREKETAKRDQRKSDTNITIELEALKAEQDKLQSQREAMQKQVDSRKEARVERRNSSFSERLAAKQKGAKASPNAK